MQLWSTGPCLIYAGIPGQSVSAAKFVGTCEEKPDIDVDFLFKPVHNDIAGGVESMDDMYVGERGQVAIDLTRWEYPVVQALCSLPNIAAALAGSAFSVPGRDDPGDIGTLMLTENQNFVLYLLFPYFNNKASMIALGPQGQAVSGYRFPGAKTNRESVQSGTVEHKKALVFDCKRTFDTTVSNQYGTGRFLLYDHVVQGLPTNT